MDTFNEEDFKKIFVSIKNKYDVKNIDEYINTVINEYQLFLQKKELKDDKISKVAIPQKYNNQEFIYFALYYFARYFLDGIIQTDLINQNLLKKSELKRIILTGPELKDRYIDLENIQRTSIDRDRLIELFEIIGNKILKEGFSTEDFIN